MTVSARHRSEAGTGLIGSAAGVAVFLVLLLFTVQLVADLYATSTVNAAGYDAARQVASRRVDHTDPAAVVYAQRAAEHRLRSLLGRFGRTAAVTWQVDDEEVRLRVEVDAPGILPSGLARRTALRHIDKTFVVRIEAVR